MMKDRCLFAALICGLLSRVTSERYEFPKGFFFGAGSSSQQIEGAWNVSDKSPNTFDVWTHLNPTLTKDGSNADVACDSYHKYKEDVRLAKDLGLDVYRISISWSRILPNGFANYISEDGIRYYRNVLTEMRANGIEPLVTLFHWNHPQNLEDMGGWTNELMVKRFADYARVIFTEFGSLVKMFTTMNEMFHFCSYAYGKDIHILAPAKRLDNYGPYLCVHNMLKAHAEAYHIYHEEFRSTQHGQIGVAFDCNWNIPYDPKNPNDVLAAEIANEFQCGWITNAIYIGDYPEIMKRQLAVVSRAEGYSESRLPKFSQKWIERIKGTSDYFGLNYYDTRAVRLGLNRTPISAFDDADVTVVENNEQTALEGFGNVLRWIRDKYDNPTIIITENGFYDSGGLDDDDRIEHFQCYLSELLKTINEDGCNVIGYCFWSLIDNYEWMLGYTVKLGVYKVDFNSPNRTRTAKRSALWWKNYLAARKQENKPNWGH